MIRIHFLLLLMAVPLCAAEVQVPLDSAGTVYTVTAELEARLQLFTVYPSFVEAKLFSVGDSSFVLEVLCGENYQVVRKSSLLTKHEVDSLRSLTSARLAGQIVRVHEPPLAEPEPSVEPSGRNKLLIGQTVAGVIFYDWAIPLAGDMQDEDAAAMFWLLAGTNYLVPMLLTEHATVTRGEATMWLYGTTRGPFHGWALGELLYKNDNIDDADRKILGTSCIVGLAEAGVFYAWADDSHMSDGRAASIGVGGDFGGACGFAAAVILNERAKSGSEEKENNTLAAGVIVGSAAGMAVYSALAQDYNYTRGDAYMMRAAGYLGAGVPLAVLATAGTDDREAYAAAGIAGTVVGLTLGHHLIKTQHRDQDAAQRVLASTVAGAMGGTGFGILASEGANEPIFLGTAIGGVAGFLIAAGSQHAKKAAPTTAQSFNFAMLRNGTESVPGMTWGVRW